MPHCLKCNSCLNASIAIPFQMPHCLKCNSCLNASIANHSISIPNASLPRLALKISIPFQFHFKCLTASIAILMPQCLNCNSFQKCLLPLFFSALFFSLSILNFPTVPLMPRGDDSVKILRKSTPQTSIVKERGMIAKRGCRGDTARGNQHGEMRGGWRVWGWSLLWSGVVETMHLCPIYRLLTLATPGLLRRPQLSARLLSSHMFTHTFSDTHARNPPHPRRASHHPHAGRAQERTRRLAPSWMT
jgi:hypothetical protein